MRISGRQVDGLIVFVLMAGAACLMSFYSTRTTLHESRIAREDHRDGPVVVRLSGDSIRRGIYYLPEDTTVLKLLKIAGVECRGACDDHILLRGLSSGQTVTLDAAGGLVLGHMSAQERLALDLPIDLNRATREELMLIPGIGEATAKRIIEYRNASGAYTRVSDLAKVRGIKEKRIKRWERYFYLPP